MSDLNAKWRELVAAGRAEWSPGMLWWHSKRAFERYEITDGQRPIEHGAAPDWDDPATLGCLLALVREAAQEPGLHVRCMLPYAPDMSGRTPPPWVLYSGRGARWGDRHETEAAALVAALEAAP
jgi:hypothetical protein